MLQSQCHTSVTSDGMVTVTFTSHEITEINVENSKKIISYSI